MGSATVKSLLESGKDFKLKLLVRPSRKSRRKVKAWSKLTGVEIVWGDLTDPLAVESLVKGADTVLHIGGMVSPAADYYPQLTYTVNTSAARNIVDAITRLGQADSTALVYIGSVSQYGPRAVPNHWGGPGDPMLPAWFDFYALSKIEAERIVAESGLKRWVSLRQSGILAPSILFKGSDPITFHVPVNGVLEWATVEDSAALMCAIATRHVPQQLWGRFFNIGSGREYRLSNYRFERLLLEALSCPTPEKAFDYDWFAARNFHGIWYTDSDELERLVPFRKNIPVKEYFRKLSSSLPFYFSFAKAVPAPVIKFFMKKIALHPSLGTLGWKYKNTSAEKLEAYFGPQYLDKDWGHGGLPHPDTTGADIELLDCGFDRKTAPEELGLEQMKAVAHRRGGECLSQQMEKGDLHKPLEWQCGCGHHFTATGATVALGGHWCPKCGYWPTPQRLATDPLLKDAYLSTHDKDETDFLPSYLKPTE